MPKVLVACVGNVFLGDDAFGVRVAERLASVRLPPDAIVKDFGIRSYDLAYALMENWDRVILVDAVQRGGAPGTVYIIEPELSDSGTTAPAVDPHTMNPAAVLQLVSALGGRVPRMFVVGCEPASTEEDEEGRMELSEPVRAAVDEACEVIQRLIAEVVNAPASEDARQGATQ
jgi:hydrogenase maturation protease